MDLRRDEPAQLRSSPRCEARTRRGTACQSPAIKGKKRCRIHGGASGSGAPRGSRNGNYRHGERTQDAVEFRRECREILEAARELIEETH
ncbi:hypothetical protein FV228_08895 [Methylobacterium sp. WL18]|nr:HGGxSTG domain-containing protein [Methylobacterium sp. WL18]TXN72943.1 hypothetical protein FV228_08895 [Methylobacterium sp. WL18]